MKKIILSVFIISIILTPLFFIKKINKVEAGNVPIISKLNYTSSFDIPTQKWKWIFTTETENVGSGAEILFSVLDKSKTGGEAVVGEPQRVIKPDNGNIIVNNVSVPKENIIYIVEAVIHARFCDNGYDNSQSVLRSTIECNATTGGCSNITIDNKQPNCVPPPKTDDPIAVSGSQIKELENKSRYNFLAPIGDLKCMDWGKKIDTTTGRTTEGCLGNNIGYYLNFIFKFGIGIAAALAVLMLIINGITYMGDESVFGKTEAKKKMYGAILGLIIAIGSWALLNTINPDLTGTSLSIDSVTADITSGNQFRLAETQNSPDAKVFKRSSYYEMIKTTTTSSGIPHCLIQVAIQRESGGKQSIGHDEDVASVNVRSRRDFIASGKKFDGSTFAPGDKNDPKITQRNFQNNDHSVNTSSGDLGLDWRFSHSVGMFGVTFGPNHINPSGAKEIYTNPNADITRAIGIMKGFYNSCNSNIDNTFRGYNAGNCTANNAFTNIETAIRVDLYNQCLAQDK